MVVDSVESQELTRIVDLPASSNIASTGSSLLVLSVTVTVNLLSTEHLAKRRDDI